MVVKFAHVGCLPWRVVQTLLYVGILAIIYNWYLLVAPGCRWTKTRLPATGGACPLSVPIPKALVQEANIAGYGTVKYHHPVKLESFLNESACHVPFQPPRRDQTFEASLMKLTDTQFVDVGIEWCYTSHPQLKIHLPTMHCGDSQFNITLDSSKNSLHKLVSGWIASHLETAVISGGSSAVPVKLDALITFGNKGSIFHNSVMQFKERLGGFHNVQLSFRHRLRMAKYAQVKRPALAVLVANTGYNMLSNFNASFPTLASDTVASLLQEAPYQCYKCL